MRKAGNSGSTIRTAKRKGFTLIELLVVISIIATLMSLILPAIQNAREAARRTQCLNNIRNVALACTNFASSNPQGHLPNLSYYPEDSAAAGFSKPFFEGRSWVVEILPFIDQQATYDRWNKDLSWQDPANLALADNLFVEAFACPNDDSAFQVQGGLSYVANAGYGSRSTGADGGPGQDRGHTFFDANFDWDSDGTPSSDADDEITFRTGVFWPNIQNSIFGVLCKNKCFAPGKIYDGTGNTLMLTENLNAGVVNFANPSLNSCGFMLPLEGGASSPGDPALVSNVVFDNIAAAVPATVSPFINESKIGPEGSPYPSSNHPGVVVAAFCDGAAKTLSESIDQNVYAQTLTPDGTRLRSLASGVPFVSESPLSGDEF